MNFLQSLRRAAQKIKFAKYDAILQQLPLIYRMYKNAGYELKCTCTACPEQYDVFKDGRQVAYMRMRHGWFRVAVPDVTGDTIYSAEPEGDGCFKAHERLVYMKKALDNIKETTQE